MAPRIPDHQTLPRHARDAPALIACARQLGLNDRIRWLGRIDGTARFELLGRAQLACMPSRYETFGRVAAEALAVATPSSPSTSRAYAPLVHPGAGATVAPGDVTALAHALLTLANDPNQCRRVGATAPATVRHLDWDAIAAAQLAVYQNTAVSPVSNLATRARLAPA
jgi:glycosyltransferase involved in cell wall biosynthesis